MSETKQKAMVKRVMTEKVADWARIDKPKGKVAYDSGYLKCPDCGTFIPICSNTVEVQCKCAWKARFTRVKRDPPTGNTDDLPPVVGLGS